MSHSKSAQDLAINIYLDVCCLNRPFDDQTQDRVRPESEAVLLILTRIQNKEWTWTGSDALLIEIEENPDRERKRRVELLLSLVSRTMPVEQSQLDRATELQTLGFRAFDALHIACAESGKADVFLTTDDRLMRLAVRMGAQIQVRVANPLVWIQEVSQL